MLNINENFIGFCDSGVGGLTVYSKFRNILNTENCLFFGDLKHSPYGNKTQQQLVGYSQEIFDFFESQNVKAVVMACNTTSAQTYPILKDKYDFKIYPIIQSCAKIFAGIGAEKLGIFATEATIQSGVYESEIKKYNPNITIFPQSCPEWVNIVETNTQNDSAKKEIIKKDLNKMLKNTPDKIILGCTHYPYLTDILSEYVSPEIFIDPAQYFADYIKKDLEQNDLLNPQTTQGTEKFYVSANPEEFKKASKMFYQVNQVELFTNPKINPQ